MTSFIVMDVLERANELQKQGVDIIHLEVGEPDFDVPSCVSEAAKRLMIVILLTIHILGDPELRREIAALSTGIWSDGRSGLHCGDFRLFSIHSSCVDVAL